MNLGIALLLLCVIITLLFLAVDFYFWWMERFPRYKIGRWSDDEMWENAVFKTGLKWLPKVPAVPVSQNKHLLLWDMLTGKFIRKSVQAWQTGGLVIGVSEYSYAASKSTVQKTISHFINSNGNWKEIPKNVDYGILAYGFLKNHPRPESLKPAMDELIQVIEKHLGEDGLIAYSGRSDIRYVDTLGLVCPFLALYAKVYQQPKYAELAIKQLEAFTEKGLYPGTYLAAHSYQLKTGLPVGIVGWGRGVGWMLLGWMDVFLELPESDAKEKLKETILAAADEYLKYQYDDGGFGIILQDCSKYDSSATAIMAYYFGQCFNITQNLSYANGMKAALQKLKTVTRRDGSLDYCQGDTVDVGIFSQHYAIMPFAQGMVLRALKLQLEFSKN